MMSNENKTSIVSGFYKLPVEKRLEFVKDFDLSIQILNNIKA